MIKSKFWRARDVEGQPPRTLTIADVTEELLGRPGGRQDVKCFLWFQESPKGLQMNATRVKLLEAAFGPDSSLWVGKRVRMSFDPLVEFGGRAVGGVKLETPPGVTYNASQNGAWGAPAGVPGRPPPPVWDDKRQVWITPPAPPAAPPNRPPPPVWNEATQAWETVSPATGEIKTGPPQTISQRVNAGHPAPGSEFDPPQEFNDDIPF
jgi:hypothetical protein